MAGLRKKVGLVKNDETDGNRDSQEIVSLQGYGTG
jgi:hypothetical protein